MIWENEWPDWHRIDEHGTEETVDDGLGRRCLGAGRCPVAPPWLVMAGRSERWCQLLCFFFLIFWKSMVIDGWETCFVCCRGQWRPPGWEVNSTVLSGTLFLLRHRSNCGDYWCSHVVRKGGGETSPKILLNCWVGVVKIPLCSDGLENGVKCSRNE